MNQLTSQQAGGALVFKGTVSEPATVTVGGAPATVTVDNRFEGQADVPQGTGQVDVVATDPSGNVRTSTYEVSQAGTPKTFTYDLNGNMTSDGTRTYEWDAENRLVAVKEGATTIASFTYNHRGIRASKTVAGVTTNYVLEGGSIFEERRSTGGATKHFHGPGIDNVLGMQDDAGSATYLTRDHLGSIREHTSAAGVVSLRRDYDPWGNLATGGATSGLAFTGREWDSETGLYYYRARVYDPAIGRFLSRDPFGFAAGPNAYTYVDNLPTVATDPSGLVEVKLSYKVVPTTSARILRMTGGRSKWGTVDPDPQVTFECIECNGGYSPRFTVDLSDTPIYITNAPLPPGLTEKYIRIHEKQHVGDLLNWTLPILEGAEGREPWDSYDECMFDARGIADEFVAIFFSLVEKTQRERH